MDSKWHTSNGQFRPGNPGGPGLTQWRLKSDQLRAAMMATVTIEDIEVVTRNLVQQAKSGDQWAIHEFYDRVIGRVKIEGDENQSDQFKEIPQTVIDKALQEAGYVRIDSGTGAGVGGR